MLTVSLYQLLFLLNSTQKSEHIIIHVHTDQYMLYIINITLISEVATALLSTSTELYDLLVLCNSEREREGGREGREGGREGGRK